MPVITTENKKEILKNVDKIPAPLKMALSSRIKEAENFINKLDRYSVLPVKLNDRIIVVSMFIGTKAPPLKITPNYDLDDLRFIAYALVRAYQKMKPDAPAEKMLEEIFGVGEPTPNTTTNNQTKSSNDNEKDEEDKEETSSEVP